MKQQPTLSEPAPIATPWYRQFWPWFLIALPTSVVVACIFTIYLAVTYKDGMVSDNYYKEGLAINQTLEQDENAKQWGLQADVTFNNQQGEITLTLLSADNAPSGLNKTPLWMAFIHPFSEKEDFSIRLMPDEVNGHFTGTLPDLVIGKWTINLSPFNQDSDQGEWRLRKQVVINDLQAQIVL